MMNAVKSVKEAAVLSMFYGIPMEEILLIALNLCGVSASVPFARGRFHMTPRGLSKSFFFALTIDSSSPFHHDGKNVLLGGEVIGAATSIVGDACIDTYHRANGLHLTINSNRRSKCRGCKFCGTYEQKSEEEGLLTRPAMMRAAEQMFASTGVVPESIALVTACFPREEDLVSHLVMMRSAFAEYGFKGEVRYIGSQLRTPDYIRNLVADGDFALYLSVEAFERREFLMREEKASLTLEAGREILAEAVRIGAETSMLYILGLDSPAAIEREFPRYAGYLSRLPLVQLMQNYIPAHEELRDVEAHAISYYLRARRLIEATFRPWGFRPLGWDNYRAPWYGTYDGKELV